MDRTHLTGMLLSRQAAEAQDCRQLSATKFIATTDWDALESHEQEYLRCYSVSAAAYKAVLVGRSAARIHGMWVIPNREELVELAQRNGNPPPKKQWPDGCCTVTSASRRWTRKFAARLIVRAREQPFA